MLRQALDLSKNALDKAKRDLGNSPFSSELIKGADFLEFGIKLNSGTPGVLNLFSRQ
jgi:hypothetical protein